MYTVVQNATITCIPLPSSVHSPQSTLVQTPNPPPPPPPGVLRQDEISETKNLGLRATGLRLGHHMVGGAGRGRVAS